MEVLNLMILRKALQSEIDVCYSCIEDAKAFQREQGFVQWHDGYPTVKTIEEDIQKGIGFVVCEDDDILGYLAIILGDDPDYCHIDGSWKTDRAYGVVHRMAFRKHSRGKGLAKMVFQMIKEYCLSHGIDAIRIDTQKENKIMQRVIQGAGFDYCGIVVVDNGPKLAYEWDN